MAEPLAKLLASKHVAKMSRNKWSPHEFRGRDHEINLTNLQFRKNCRQSGKKQDFFSEMELRLPGSRRPCGIAGGCRAVFRYRHSTLLRTSQSTARQRPTACKLQPSRRLYPDSNLALRRQKSLRRLDRKTVEAIRCPCPA